MGAVETDINGGERAAGLLKRLRVLEPDILNGLWTWRGFTLSHCPVAGARMRPPMPGNALMPLPPSSRSLRTPRWSDSPARWCTAQAGY